MRIHSYGFWISNVVQVSIRKSWCWRLYISETITPTETWVALFGSVTHALGQSENGTRISLTVSEIFAAKNNNLTPYFFILLPYSSFRQKQGHVSPPTGMVRSWKFRHHIKARDRTKRIFDFGGKIPTRWFPMRGKQVPHYKHRRRSITYLMREFPVKNRESCGRGSTHEKIVG